MLILSVQSTASFFTLMFGISYSVFISIEMPIQLHSFVSMFWLSYLFSAWQPIFCRFSTKLVFSLRMLNLKLLT